MTRSWPETRLLDAEAAQVRPARFDTHLRTSTLLETPYSDPRVVDPALERIIDDAAERAAFAGREEGFAQGYAEGVVLGRAVSRAPHGAPVSVSLNPDDLRTARDLRVDLEHAAGRAVELRADSSVPRGGAVADSGARRIDGCLQPALDRLRAELAP